MTPIRSSAPRLVLLSALLTTASLAVGCAPADVAGDYTVATTYGDNECGLSGWNAGESQTGIPVRVTQDGGDVEVEVQGLSAVTLGAVTGGTTFVGHVSGNRVSADLIGSSTARQGGCAYTLTLELEASLQGDALEGEIAWRPVTNRHPDCGTLDACSNLQRFSGVRPPR
jgi:hypothetical protein